MVTIGIPILVSFGCALFVSVLILTTKSIHGRFSFDSNTTDIHKYHNLPTPRIGGIAFLFGLAVGGAYHGFQADQTLLLAKWAGIAALPVFLGGFFEDITNRVSPRDRLLLSFLSAAIAFYELDVGLAVIGWPWFDENVLTIPGVSLVLTMVMLGGVAHAANIIDGFNGLLLGFSVFALATFCYVSFQIGENILIIYMGIMIGAMLGVFCLNFPKGKLFLGDGGAYLIGFLLALFSLLLVKKHSDISPWFPLLVLIYPVNETLFSMYRKKVVSGKSAMQPDDLHLHMLIYKNFGSSIGELTKLDRNPATAVIMWGVGVLPMIPAMIWWDQPRLLVLCVVIFIGGYIITYQKLAKSTIQNR